jgi:hypothetical protein
MLLALTSCYARVLLLVKQKRVPSSFFTKKTKASVFTRGFLTGPLLLAAGKSKKLVSLETLVNTRGFFL